jgi:hypothetical protein
MIAMQIVFGPAETEGRRILLTWFQIMISVICKKTVYLV